MGDDEVDTGELARTLGRFEQTLDRVEARLATQLADHEQRLRRLERMTYVAVGLAVAGGSSGVGALLSTVGS